MRIIGGDAVGQLVHAGLADEHGSGGSSFSTTAASRSGTKSANSFEPQVVRTPLVSKTSFTSDRNSVERPEVNLSTQIFVGLTSAFEGALFHQRLDALSLGFSARTCAIAALVNSTEETLRARNAAAAS